MSAATRKDCRVSIPTNFYEIAEELAEQEGVTISQFIVVMISAWKYGSKIAPDMQPEEQQEELPPPPEDRTIRKPNIAQISAASWKPTQVA